MLSLSGVDVSLEVVVENIALIRQSDSNAQVDSEKPINNIVVAIVDNVDDSLGLPFE